MRVPFKYNRRSLWVRKASTLMTVGSIALVVLITVGVLAMAAGLESAFGRSGDPNNLLVLRDGSRSETESRLAMEVFRQISARAVVESVAGRAPLASGELVVINILRREDGSESNVALRGVGDAAFDVRPQLEMLAGRRFIPGRGEIIVGRNLPSRYPELRLGEDVTLGRLRFRVVGVFAASGAAAESEVWGAREDLGNAYRLPNVVSSIRLRAADGVGVAPLAAAVASDRRWRVKALAEDAYFAEQVADNTTPLRGLGLGLGLLMGIGACFAAANTMYAQVAARRREIGTLRALGFRRRTVLLAFVGEALLLGLAGGMVGVLLALPLNAITAGTSNAVTFSEITFRLDTSLPVLAIGLLLAALTGVVGGLPPALAAARQRITGLLRDS